MDYIIVPIALLFGFSLKSLFKKFNAKDHILLDQLFFYHMIMSFVFYIYIRSIGGDAWGYWRWAKESNIQELWAEWWLKQQKLSWEKPVNNSEK